MRAPPFLFVLGVLAALVALPLGATLGAGEVGGYRMFTRLARLHLTLDAENEGGDHEPVEAAELAAHLRRDAQRVVLSALERGTIGDTAEPALAAALGPLGALACQLDRRRVRVAAVLTIERAGEAAERRAETTECR